MAAGNSFDTTVNVFLDVKKATQSLNTLTRGFKALAGVIAVREILQFTDAAINLENKLRLVSTGSADLARNIQAVQKIANAAGASIGSTATLYQRLSRASDTLGLTQQGVARTTELITKALATAGLQSSELSSVMTQLSQAFNKGTLNGDEFRTMAENFPDILRFVAKELNINTTAVRKYAEEGKLTGTVLRDAFLNNAKEIEDKFGNRMETVGMAIERIKNNATVLFLEFNRAVPIFSLVADALSVVANNMERILYLTVGLGLASMIAGWGRFAQALKKAATFLGAVGVALASARAAFLRFGGLIAAIYAGLEMGGRIYSGIIKPLFEAGKTSGEVAKYIAHNLVNAFFQVAAAALDAFTGIAVLMTDLFTPGVNMADSWNQYKQNIEDSLKKTFVNIMSSDEIKKFEDLINGKTAGSEGGGALTTDEGKIKELTEDQQKILDTFRQQVAESETQVRLLEERAKLGQQWYEVESKIQHEMAKMDERTRQAAENDLGRYRTALARAQVAEEEFELAKKLTALHEGALFAAMQANLIQNGKSLKAAEDQVAVREQMAEIEKTLSKAVYENNKIAIQAALELEQAEKRRLKDTIASEELLQDLRNQSWHLTGKDRFETERIIELEKYRRSVGHETYMVYKDQVELAIQTRQEVEQIKSTEAVLLDYANRIAISTADTVRAQERENALLQYKATVSEEIFEQYRGQVEEAIRLEQIQKEIASAMTNYRTELGGALATRNEELQTLREIAAATEDVYQYAALNAVALRKEKEMRAEILELIGDGEGALLKQQEIELDRIKFLRDQQIINAEEAARASAEIQRKYADKVYDYKIKKMEDELARELELNGIRVKLGDKEIELLEVNKDTARQIARDRTEFEKKTEFEKTQFFLEQSATLFNALGAQNKKAFQAAKALNIAVALMNTYRAATIALATYPPPFNFIAMAAAIATGLAQVATIRSQQYSGRALGGGVMGGGSYLVGERGPEIFTPANNGNITRNSDLGNMGGTTNVNFTIVANDTRGFDQLLTERRGVITQIIADAQLEKGRR